MSDWTVWDVCGWLGNACFFSRFFVQWWASERAKQSVAPASFWYLSLLGTITLGLYAASRETYVLLAGYFVNGLIYGRNIGFVREQARGLSGWVASALALGAGALLVAASVYELRHREESSLAWVVVAAVGQAFWSARFVLQWWASERAGESHFPRLFWWLSLVGNALLLAFAIHLADAKFIAGFVPGPIVQIRNLMLGRKRAA
ncbi:MAG: lipid-A-disaccharide synthase N-terminal domain-containing protein [Planctomycetes bacterium]|nr:lipid-A-disaccharide synthase N-terminal domain-containing protein [Planctomycetota bacterium]